MKCFLTCFLWMCVAAISYAQDFSTLFLKAYDNDSIFTQVTISPKMMEEILQSDAQINEDMAEVISELKSLRMLIANSAGDEHFAQTLGVIEKNRKRYQYLTSHEEANDSCRILVRKKNDRIVELVMVMLKNEGFMLVDITGVIKPESISTLTKSLKSEG